VTPVVARHSNVPYMVSVCDQQYTEHGTVARCLQRALLAIDGLRKKTSAKMHTLVGVADHPSLPLPVPAAI
jgi:hypothetical protein